jgi:hypothetical protein
VYQGVSKMNAQTVQEEPSSVTAPLNPFNDLVYSTGKFIVAMVLLLIIIHIFKGLKN